MLIRDGNAPCSAVGTRTTTRATYGVHDGAFAGSSLTHMPDTQTTVFLPGGESDDEYPRQGTQGCCGGTPPDTYLNTTKNTLKTSAIPESERARTAGCKCRPEVLSENERKSAKNAKWKAALSMLRETCGSARCDGWRTIRGAAAARGA